VLEGIEAARRIGFSSIKLNTVLIRGYNQDEIVPLLEFAQARGLELRFIEYMDVGGASRWRLEDVISRTEILRTIEARLGPVAEHDQTPELRGAAPAERFRLADGTVFGIIASTTAPFCGSCDRSRVTADGTWFLCLYADQGVDLRTPLRTGWSDQAIQTLITNTWTARIDRGAEQRLASADRGALYSLERLRADPRREMHTRGG
jgi:cyclic pyranopterin phosphate synthase